MDGELCSHFYPRVPSLYDHLQLSGPWGNDAEKRWTLEVQEFVLLVKRAMKYLAGRGRSILPHTLLLQLLNSISDGPPRLSPGTSSTSAQSSLMTESGSATTFSG